MLLWGWRRLSLDRPLNREIARTQIPTHTYACRQTHRLAHPDRGTVILLRVNSITRPNHSVPLGLNIPVKFQCLHLCPPRCSGSICGVYVYVITIEMIEDQQHCCLNMKMKSCNSLRHRRLPLWECKNDKCKENTHKCCGLQFDRHRFHPEDSTCADMNEALWHTCKTLHMGSYYILYSKVRLTESGGFWWLALLFILSWSILIRSQLFVFLKGGALELIKYCRSGFYWVSAINQISLYVLVIEIVILP